jgi:AcrR family transcriptional regulator
LFERTFENIANAIQDYGKSFDLNPQYPRDDNTAPRSAPATRYDRRLAEILAHATEVFCEKGYEGASMRDLSRASRMSLAGLYYYFESKERLLYF